MFEYIITSTFYSLLLDLLLFFSFILLKDKRMWQKNSWSNGLSGDVYQLWKIEDVFTPVAVKDSLVLCERGHQQASPVYKRVQEVLNIGFEAKF